MTTVTNLTPRTAIVNITIWQGSTFKRVFVFKNKTTNLPIDLTGVDGRMDIKNPEDGTLLHTLNVANGGITFTDPVNGTVQLKIPDADTTLFPAGTYKYDLEFIYPPDADVFKEIAGKFKVDAEVTTSS
jgi:hypothetical protein